MNREKSLNLILERIWFCLFNSVYEYKDIFINGYFVVFISVVLDDIKKKFYIIVIYEEVEVRRYENILNKVLEVKVMFKDKSVVYFIFFGVFKNGDEGEEIVCMFYKKKMGEEL